MPVADTDKRTCEIVLAGVAAGKGSDPVNTFNVFQFRRTSSAPALSKTAIITAFTTAVGNVIAAAMNESWAMAYITARFMEDITDAPTQVIITTAGAITGDRLSCQNTVVVTLKTALRGRRYRGRKTFSPISESDTTAATADLINAAAITRFSAVGAAIVAGFTDAQGNVWVPCVCTKFGRDLTVTPAVIPSNDVVDYLLNKRIGRFRNRQVASQY